MTGSLVVWNVRGGAAHFARPSHPSPSTSLGTRNSACAELVEAFELFSEYTETSLSVQTMEKIAKALGVSIEELIK